MSKLKDKILQWPAEELKQKSETVILSDGLQVDKTLRTSLIRDMLKLCEDPTIVGVAAVQLGRPLRIICLYMEVEDDEHYLVMINPKISNLSPTTVDVRESCLSVDNAMTSYVITRAKRTKVKYTDLDGVSHTLKGRGLLSRVLQHEMDHLDGKTIADIGRDPQPIEPVANMPENMPIQA